MVKQIGKMNPFNYGINNVFINNDNGVDTYGNGALGQGFNIPRLSTCQRSTCHLSLHDAMMGFNIEHAERLKC